MNMHRLLTDKKSSLNREKEAAVIQKLRIAMFTSQHCSLDLSKLQQFLGSNSVHQALSFERVNGWPAIQFP